jgi:hypothetical protein
MGVASAVAVTISATYNGVTKTAVLTVNPAALASLTFSPGASVGGGAAATVYVNLNGFAPPAGALIALSSSDPLTAAIPASVTIASGHSSASVTATTVEVTTSTPVTLTATYAGGNVNAVLSVDPIWPASVTLPPGQKAGGFFYGTLTLNGPAPADGITVAMTASGAASFLDAYSNPVSSLALSISAGHTGSTFQMLANWSATAGTATVTASANGITTTGTAAIAAGTANLSIPAALARGSSGRGTIRFDLCGPTLLSFPVALASSNPGVVLSATSVSAATTSPIYCSSTWSFALGVTTGSISDVTTISATFLGLTKTAPLTVNPSVLTSISVRPTEFPGGVPVTAIATLDSPAPPDGAIISLSSSSPGLLPLPATVTIPAGAVSTTFTFIPNSVSVTTPVTVSASYGPATGTAAVQLLADGAAHVFGTVVDASIYDHDQLLTGVAVGLTTDAANTTATDAQGAFSLYLDQGTSAVTLSLASFASTTLPFTAAPGASIDTGKTRLKRILTGTQSVSGRVINAAGNPVQGATGSVEGYQGTFTTDSSGHYSFSGPDLNRYRLTFSAASYLTRTDDTFPVLVITTLTDLKDFVLDTVARPVLSAISITPNPVVGGTNATLTLTLSAPASSTPISGATVSLVFSNPAATATFDYANIPAGSSSRPFVVTTNAVTTPQSTVITAFYGGVQLATMLIVVPASGVLSSVSVNPPLVIGGSPSTGTVTLNGPAPSGGVSVSLSSSDPAAVVPASVSVPSGATSATFAITTSSVTTTHTVTITAVYGYTKTATLTVTPPPPASLIAVAPGWVLPGDTTPLIYGSNIQPGSSVIFEGPVYLLTDTVHQLCVPDASCASSALTATVGTDGSHAAFAVPIGAASGIYYLKVRSALGVDSSNNQWIAVDSAQQTRPQVPASQHKIAQRIYPGQTVTGTLTGDNPEGDAADYNLYYFVATAGSQISAAMTRVDTSVPWENPASLDPQIDIVAPDGFIYSNLQALDNQPNLDLNASLTNAVLPQTGMYILSASTARGSGQYQLTFNITSMAPAPVGSRAIPITGNHNTVPLNASVNVEALLLDARGWPVAGAAYAFASQNGTGDTGTVSFLAGGSGTTSLSGTADATLNMTTQGKARFKAGLISPLLSQYVYVPTGAAAAVMGEVLDASTGGLRIPVYRPVGRSPARIVGISGLGAELAGMSIKRFPEVHTGSRIEVRSAKGASALRITPPPLGHAAGAAPSARATALGVVAVPLAITACSGEIEIFTQTGVTAANLNAPFDVVLTDVTPGEAEGAVDTTSGIHGHRIERADGTSRVLRLHLEVKDASGNTPTHPVLVSLAVGGPQHGTLILDPDGTRLECVQASFVWHERDAQGNLIAANDEFEYRLGTLAVYAGAVPDQAHPGQVLPVWGETESVRVTINTVDGSGNASPLTMFDSEYPVLPEPGKPNQLLSQFDLMGKPDDQVWSYWADFMTSPPEQGPLRQSGVYQVFNSYYLVDRWDNVTFGYGNAVSPSTPANLTVGFANQLQGSSVSGVEFEAYETDVSWSNLGGSMPMPSGDNVVPLTVNYSDGEYGTGSVVTNLTLRFLAGTYSALMNQEDYDLRFGVDDGTWPITVAPAATGAAIPSTTNGGQPTARRLNFQIVTGSSVPQKHEVFESPHNVWNLVGATYVLDHTETRDPHLEVSDPGRMRLSVVDGQAQPVTDVAFQAHNCPRYDHEGPPNQPIQSGRACTDQPVQSVSGVIPSYLVNQAGGNRGYLGVELLVAPTTPGTYYLLLESLDARYRMQVRSVQVDATPAGDFKGAFTFCVVSPVEFLDSSFQRLPSIDISDAATVYLRATVANPQVSGFDATVSTDGGVSGAVDPNPTALRLDRLGRSSTFIGSVLLQADTSGTITVPAFTATAQQLSGAQFTKTLQAGLQTLFGVVTPVGQAKQATNTVFEPAVRIDTTASGQQPNLLLTDGVDSLTATITLVTPSGAIFNAGSEPISVTADAGAAVVVSQFPPPVAGVTIKYTAPSIGLSLGNSDVKRPTFTVQRGSATPATFAFGDAIHQTPRYQWPMYYSGHNFKNLLSNDEFTFPGTLLPSEAAVQAFLENLPSSPLSPGGRSFLKDFYFVNMPDPPAGTKLYPTDPVDGFVDTNGNGAYDVGEPVYCALGRICQPLTVTSVTRLSHVLFDMSQRYQVSAANMVTNLQKEAHFAEEGLSTVLLDPQPKTGTSPLDAAMGCGLHLQTPPLGFVRQLVCGAATLATQFSTPETVNLQFFPAPSGTIDDSTPQKASVRSENCQNVAVAFQPLTKASRAESVYTNWVINCDRAGTYSFAYWWYYFFGGPL